MTDCFALLQQPRRPWLDPEVLKTRFLSLSATAHPDRAHATGAAEQKGVQDHYAELNAAFQRLRQPKERLKHLLELERGTPPGQVQTVPNDLMDVSMTVGQLCRQVDSFLEEKNRATSPMLQVQLFGKTQEYIERLRQLEQRVAGQREQLLEQLRALDAEWVDTPTAEPHQRTELLNRLEGIYPVLSYFDRWLAQIQERLVQLVL